MKEPASCITAYGHLNGFWEGSATAFSSTRLPEQSVSLESLPEVWHSSTYRVAVSSSDLIHTLVWSITLLYQPSLLSLTHSSHATKAVINRQLAHLISREFSFSVSEWTNDGDIQARKDASRTEQCMWKLLWIIFSRQEISWLYKRKSKKLILVFKYSAGTRLTGFIKACYF